MVNSLVYSQNMTDNVNAKVCLVENENVEILEKSEIKVDILGEIEKNHNNLLPKITSDDFFSRDFRRMLLHQKTQVNVIHDIFDFIVKIQKFKGLFLDEYVQISSKRLRKLFGSNYKRHIRKLIELGIIECINSYSNSKSNWFYKSYRVNPVFFDVPTILNSSIITNEISKKGDTIKKICNVGAIDFCEEATRSIYDTMKINLSDCEDGIINYISNKAFTENIKIDSDISYARGIDINYSQIYYFASREKIKTSTKKALKNAIKNNMNLIKDGRKYTIDYYERYVERKKKDTRKRYEMSALKIADNKIFFKRSKKEKRLYTNITSIPNLLLKYITINDEPLAYFDLKNSHPTFLADLIQTGYFNDCIDPVNFPENQKGVKFISSNNPTNYSNTSNFSNENIPTSEFFDWANVDSTSNNSQFKYKHELDLPEDIKEFIENAQKGKIYEWLQQVLKLESRAEAKQAMMELMYSSHKYRLGYKGYMQYMIPNVIQMVDNFKKKHTSKEFSIYLQKRESEIFIDRILMTLLKMGCSVLSKHDSIVFPISIKDTVEKVMREILDEELGGYVLDFGTYKS